MNTMRALAARSRIRRVFLHPVVRKVLSVILRVRFVPAIWKVREPIALAWHTVRGQGSAVYHLRTSGNPILLRHSESPIELLHEIFREECYRVPDGLANKLPRTPRILDVGANVGAFSAFAFEVWPDAKIMAIEPDQANLAELEKFAALRPENTIEIVAAAASTSSEPVHFASGLGSGSKISDEGDEVAAVDLLPLLKEFDLMKLDIEGGEWPILADHRMSDAGPLVIVMEYHRRAPGDMGALVAAKDLLTSAGFAVGYEQPNYWGHGLLWAWTK